ncbi:hypothetical protein [Kitasatospora sp. NPDC098663]|uniref:hypothetical protein n=1 Tax=Kitasatospora sp. NPDC098663 TaxID=3364096 RepID=UPI0037F43F76
MPNPASAGPCPGVTELPSEQPSQAVVCGRSQEGTALRASGMGGQWCEKPVEHRSRVIEGEAARTAGPLDGDVTLICDRVLGEQVLRSASERLGITVSVLTT